MSRSATGSIHKRSDGRWAAQVSITDPISGQRRRKTRICRSRDAARQALKELRSQPIPTAAAEQGTVKQWLTDYVQPDHLAPATRDQRAYLLKSYAIPAIGRVRGKPITLAELTPDHCDRWVSQIRASLKRDGEPISPSTARSTYDAAAAALDQAVRARLITANPLRETPRPVMPRATVPVTTPAQVEALILKAGEDDHARIRPLLVVVADTGMRIGEALALRWSDVEDGAVTIRRGSQRRAATKTGRHRSITLTTRARQALKDQRKAVAADRLRAGEVWQDHGLVFPSRLGTAQDRNNVTRELKRVMEAAGVPTVRPWHSLRHGLAHRLLAAGVPLHTASAILGHSGLAITADIYGHVDSRVPLDTLEGALGL